MSSPLFIYSLLIGLSAGLSLAAIAWTWSRFHAQGASAFLLWNLGTFFFALGSLWEAYSSGLPGLWGSLALRSLGFAALGPLWLTLVWGITGSSVRQHKPVLFLLFLLPVATVLLASTSSFHTLFFARITPQWEGDLSVPRLELGPLALVHLLFQAATFLTGGIILVVQALRSSQTIRTALFWLLGTMAPAAAALLLQAGGWRPFVLDITPLLLSFSGGMMVLVFHSTRLLDLPPLNAYRLTESLKEGLALFDGHGHLLGFNPAMARIHPFFSRENLGKPPTSQGTSPDLEELLLAEPIKTLEIPGRKEGERRVFQVNRSPLRGRLGEPSGHIILLSDITSRVEMTEKLSFLARTDELTGIANRRYFFERLREESDRCDRYGGSFALAIIDLDHFKSFNDTWGHDVGDAVLRRAVKIWEGCLRTSDLLARYGGEEFGLLIPGSGISESLQLLERMNRSLQFQDTPDGDPRLKITASVGLAQYRTGEDIHDLIRRADEALYEAKNQGRNRICTASEQKS